jgi:hypothetical protein
VSAFTLTAPQGHTLGGMTIAPNRMRDYHASCVGKAVVMRLAGNDNGASLLDNVAALTASRLLVNYGGKAAAKLFAAGEHHGARHVIAEAGKLPLAVLDRLSVDEWLVLFAIERSEVDAAVEVAKSAQVCSETSARSSKLTHQASALRRRAAAVQHAEAELQNAQAWNDSKRCELARAQAQRDMLDGSTGNRGEKSRATRALNEARTAAVKAEQRLQEARERMDASAKAAELTAEEAQVMAKADAAALESVEAQQKHRAAMTAWCAVQAAANRKGDTHGSAVQSFGDLLDATTQNWYREGRLLDAVEQQTGERYERKTGGAGYSGAYSCGKWQALERSPLSQGAQDFAEAVRVDADANTVVDEFGARVASPALVGWAVGALRTPLCTRRAGRQPVAVQLLVDVSGSTGGMSVSLGVAAAQLVRALRAAGHDAAVDAWNGENCSDEQPPVLNWSQPLDCDFAPSKPSGGTDLTHSAAPRMGRLQSTARVGMRQLVVVLTDGETRRDDRESFLRKASCPCAYIIVESNALAPDADEGWRVVLRTSAGGLLEALTGAEFVALMDAAGQPVG